MYNETVEESVKRLEAKSTASVEKLMRCMISKYRYLHSNILGKKSADYLNREGIRWRINWLLRVNNFSIRTPKIIDSRMCIRFETLQLRFNNKDIVEALTSVHLMFLLSVDETEKPENKNQMPQSHALSYFSRRNPIQER